MADLRECEIVSLSEANEYEEADVVGCVPLWEEGCYRADGEIGPCLVRKGARKSPDKRLRKLTAELRGAIAHGSTDFAAAEVRRELEGGGAGESAREEARKWLKNAEIYERKMKEYHEEAEE